MTTPVTTQLTQLTSGAQVAHITLAAPRSNALTPSFLRAIHSALDHSKGAEALLISGGPNFSTGGDVAAFLRAAETGVARTYARETVGLLQDLVFRLVSSQAIVAVAARGATTGGGCGMLFAADQVVGAPDLFVQPYYTTVGFAPDGGWRALLPDRIGAAAVEDWLSTDRRWHAPDLKAASLIDAISDQPDLRARRGLETLGLASARAAKKHLWPPARLQALRARLDDETEAFVARIDRPEVIDGMRRFLADLKVSKHV